MSRDYYQRYCDIESRYEICVKHSASQTRIIEEKDAEIAALHEKVERALMYIKAWGNLRTNKVDITRLRQILTER